MFSLYYYNTFGYYAIETNSNRQYGYMLSNVWIDSTNMHSITAKPCKISTLLFSEELVMITEMLVFNKPYCQKCWFLLKHIAPDV